MTSTITTLSLAAMNPNIDWRQLGDIVARYSDDGELVILNYTAAAQYANRWNPYERVCRGLILNTKTGEVVARAYDKFFNWGDDAPSPKAHLAEVTEKLDGSMGILYRHHGQFYVATRGAFTSDQALWATDFLRRKYDLSRLPDRLTLLFEIIFAANRVIIDYGSREDLVLIGVRDRITGGDWFMVRIKDLARDYGFNTPNTFDTTDPSQFVEAAKSLTTNQEGYVLRFSDGKRFKIKGDAYLSLHRMKFAFSFNRILEAVQQKVDSDYIAALPDDMQQEALQYQQQIADKIKVVVSRITTEFSSAPKTSRKEFALWVNANYPTDAAYLFAMLDGKDLLPYIYRIEF